LYTKSIFATITRIIELIEENEGWIPDYVEWASYRVHFDNKAAIIPLLESSMPALHFMKKRIINCCLMFGVQLWERSIKDNIAGGFSALGYSFASLSRICEDAAVD
jgi:hypothetical protein